MRSLVPPLLIVTALLGALVAVGLLADGSGTPVPPAATGDGRAAPDASADEVASPGRASDGDDLPTGLTYDAEEVARWRKRARVGPYRVPDDVSPGSPGDWERISANAERFRDNPSAGRWTSADGSGCVRAGSDGPPSDGIAELRDAAFVALVTDDGELRGAVAEELVAQAGEDGLDFADADRWCAGVVDDRRPGFEIAAWMTKLVLAHDHVGPDAFDPDDLETLRSWFLAGARWLKDDADRKLDENFVDRSAGDYLLAPERQDGPGWGSVGFLGSQEVGAVARYYNNRRATSMYLVGLVGVLTGEEDLVASSKRFVQEWLAYSVYPDGWTGEFERRRGDLPDLGWAYSTYNVALAVLTADLLSRHGDDALLTYTTSEGVHGTQGGEKSLRWLLREHVRYLDGTYERYASGRSEADGDPDLRIDGYHEPAAWDSVHDLGWLVALRHYDDPLLRDVARRTAPGTRPYPDEPATQAGFSAWSGVWGLHPGVLFMYGPG